MICAPATGWARSRRDSSVSAGGQLEQPSLVKSSTITGTRLSSAWAASRKNAAKSVACFIGPPPVYIWHDFWLQRTFCRTGESAASMPANELRYRTFEGIVIKNERRYRIT